MNYFYGFFGLLIILILTDILGYLIRFRLSGIKALYELVFLDIGYRKQAGSIGKSSDHKTILIVGDSTAVGPGAPPEETIGGRIAKNFDIDVINLAVNGATTEDIIRQIDGVSGQRFFMTIVHAGNNDIWRLTNLKKLKGDITLLLDEAKKISEKVILFRGGNIGSCPFFPLTIGWVYSIRSKKVRELFKRVAEEKSVLYVEKFMKRREDVFLKDPHRFYCWDLLHLNGNGYKVWFDYLLEEMKKAGISF